MLRNLFGGIRPPWNRCPQWEYGHSPRAGELAGRIAAELSAIRLRPRDMSAEYVTDPRPLHARLFQGLTLPGQPYLSGNYRGHPRYECLRRCVARVRVQGGGFDETFPPVLVHAMMRRCSSEILAEMAVLDSVNASNAISAEEKLAQIIEAAAYILGGFNVVHPFANGNGHVSRLLVFAFLSRYGYEPKSWLMHSPKNQADRDAYDALFLAFRANDSKPLQNFLFDKVAGR
jgi:Fic/DOC family protein